MEDVAGGTKNITTAASTQEVKVEVPGTYEIAQQGEKESRKEYLSLEPKRCLYSGGGKRMRRWLTNRTKKKSHRYIKISGVHILTKARKEFQEIDTFCRRSKRAQENPPFFKKLVSVGCEKGGQNLRGKNID